MYVDIWFILISSTFPSFRIYSRLRKFKNIGNINMNPRCQNLDMTQF